MDFDKICMMFSMQEAFYGILLSSMQRVAVKDLEYPMAVTRSGNVFRLMYNPDMLEKFDVPTILEFIKHEVLHVAFNHFTIWEDERPSQDIQKVRNYAADMEVNCYIKRANVHNIQLIYPENYGLEKELGTREYFRRLMEMAEKQKQNQQQACGCGDGAGDTEDDVDEDENENSTNPNENNDEGDENENTPQQNNDEDENDDNGDDEKDGENNGNSSGIGAGKGWDNSDEEDKIPQSFFNQFKDCEDIDDHTQWPTGDDAETSNQMVEDLLIQAAEEVEKGCGHIPGEMRVKIDEIKNRRKPKPVADWKRYVRRYLGNEFSEFIRKSKKRESRRFPDAAGNRHRRKSHILVAIDTSGSVSMPEYLEFFGQIRTLTAVASFDVVECDTQINHTYTFRGKPNMEVHGGGGTDFQPPVDFYNKNRKKYDALIYFTDGECSVPKDTPKDTLWVISSRGDKNDRKRFQVNGASVVFIPPKQ